MHGTETARYIKKKRPTIQNMIAPTDGSTTWTMDPKTIETKDILDMEDRWDNGASDRNETCSWDKQMHAETSCCSDLV